MNKLNEVFRVLNDPRKSRQKYELLSHTSQQTQERINYSFMFTFLGPVQARYQVWRQTCPGFCLFLFIRICLESVRRSRGSCRYVKLLLQTKLQRRLHAFLRVINNRLSVKAPSPQFLVLFSPKCFPSISDFPSSQKQKGRGGGGGWCENSVQETFWGPRSQFSEVVLAMIVVANNVRFLLCYSNRTSNRKAIKQNKNLCFSVVERLKPQMVRFIVSIPQTLR